MQVNKLQCNTQQPFPIWIMFFFLLQQQLNHIYLIYLCNEQLFKTNFSPQKQVSHHTQYTGWNDEIVTLEKTTWFYFHLMKTGFLFFVADHLQVGQLCTNPKSDRSLLSCLKVTQCSMSEIEDALLYNSYSILIKVMTTGPLPAHSKCKSGLPQITGTCPGWWKQSFRLRLWS